MLIPVRAGTAATVSPVCCASRSSRAWPAYEDVNDADRLCRDPVMRQFVGDRAVKHGAASASAMGRFETEMLTRPENLEALAELPGRWIDAVHDRQSPKSITLDMDSSESPVHGDQEGAAWNGHFQSKWPATRSSSSTNMATWSGVFSGPATCTAPMAGKMF